MNGELAALPEAIVCSFYEERPASKRLKQWPVKVGCKIDGVDFSGSKSREDDPIEHQSDWERGRPDDARRRLPLSERFQLGAGPLPRSHDQNRSGECGH